MSRPQESFADAELTSLAMEIIQDLSTKPQIDPNDEFICKLAEEIEMEILHAFHYNNGSYNTDNAHASSTSFTDPSLYLPLSNTSSSMVHDRMMTPATHPEVTPTIISHSQLSANDSFNLSFPSIPSSKPSKSVPYTHNYSGNKKRAIHSHTTKRNKTQSFSPFSSRSPRYTPFHPPVSINLSLVLASSEGRTGGQSPVSITSDISSCMSPRDQTPKSRVSVIPDFCGDEEITIRIPKETKKSNAKVAIDIDVNQRDNNNKKKRSMTPTPRVVKKNRLGFKGRTNSNVLTRNEMAQYNEYAVESEDGFIFFKPCNMRKQVV